MDYVPPAVIPEDIRDVKPGEWLWLFDEVLRTSIYDTLVLDIGDCVQGLYSILGVCDEIYMPVADDPAAASRSGSLRIHSGRRDTCTYWRG